VNSYLQTAVPPEGGDEDTLSKIALKGFEVTLKQMWDNSTGGPTAEEKLNPRPLVGEHSHFGVTPKVSSAGFGVALGYSYSNSSLDLGGGTHLSNFRFHVGLVGIYPWQWAPEELEALGLETDGDPVAKLEVSVSWTF
jgi:hypothetical protein